MIGGLQATKAAADRAERSIGRVLTHGNDETMQATHPHFWETVCKRCKTEAPELFRAWFEDLRPAGLEGGQLTLHVSDPARLQYLRDRGTETLSQLASAVSGQLVSIAFEPFNVARVTRRSDAYPVSRLDADYTFDEFVIGANNRLAHAACRAVHKSPGSLYNPLFVHGATGVGKSHLLQAVCHDYTREDPSIVVVYVSCETFMNEFIRALEGADLPRFRDKYRRADVLAIDDVQFLSERESTQEEFFHTFNVLFQDRRQILLSADSPPRDIPALEERLVSRFNWGLVALIEQPDFETRRAILQKKARLRGYEVPPAVLDMIAQRVENNVRLLEGALIKCVLDAQVRGVPLTPENLARTLDDVCDVAPPRQLGINDILEMVTTYYGIRLAELIGKRRSRSIVQPRQMGMYLARKLTSMSLVEIGDHFDRDHSTVLHAERLIERLARQDAAIGQDINVLTKRLRALR